jgi:hypothetical protein
MIRELSAPSLIRHDDGSMMPMQKKARERGSSTMKVLAGGGEGKNLRTTTYFFLQIPARKKDRRSFQSR